MLDVRKNMIFFYVDDSKLLKIFNVDDDANAINKTIFTLLKNLI